MIGLVADDLTGASDAGVQFTRAGLSARVLFEARPPLPHADVDALAIDTDSRALPPPEAYARVREAASALRQLPPRHIYKKIDSTLRGNLGPEIDAIMDAFDAPLAIVAPAFPSLGRTTRDGTHFVRGTPVAETETAHDPRAPVHESNIVRLLQTESRSHHTPGLIPLQCVKDGPAAVRRCIDVQRAQGLTLMVCDAESDEHLRTIVDSMSGEQGVVWVGSAGLAEHVAARVEPTHAHAARPAPQAPDGPILLVCGSLSEVTHRQARAFAAQADVSTIELDPAALAGSSEHRRVQLEAGRRAVAAALQHARDCAVTVGAHPVASADASERIAAALGELAVEVIHGHPLGGVILTGGDTARAVCHALGVTGIDLFDEVEPGVPLGRLIGALELPAVTKAGAFGSDGALVQARRRLRRLSQKGITTR